jgi:uncharacterized membrane protein YgaE (UPF0421/DUF939 family)
MARRLDDRLRDPLVWTGVLQLAKTVAAAVIAWLLAVKVFSLPQSFLAPWAALLTVHATVYRTLARGMQQAAGAVVGVLLAFAVAHFLGVSWASLALVLLAARALGAMRPMRAEPTAAAATALVVLLMGYSDDGAMLVARLGDTFIGIAVGLVVNLAVWPPLRDRSAARRIDDLDDRIGALLADMANGLRSDDAPDPHRWVEHTRELDHGIDDAWADVRRARESGRLNLRRQAARRIQDTRDLGDVLVDLEQAVADARSMARTIGRAGAVAGWEPRFRDTWVAILGRAADAVRDANVDDVHRVREDLESVARRYSHTNGDRARRPVQGALVVNLRNILEAMAPVAAAQPVRVRSR